MISAVVLAFSGAAGSQLFAAVHDDLRTTASPVADGVFSIVRMALTAGWVVGPVPGAALPGLVAKLSFEQRRAARPQLTDASAGSWPAGAGLSSCISFGGRVRR